MAKDPATLWYWNDWHSGTILLSRFLKGCYMDLLHAQFNHGPLSLEEVKAVLGGDFGQAWPTLSKKFSEANGRYFNERMEDEKKKRKKHSEHQSNNAKKRWDKCDGISDGNATAYPKLMPLENRNENEDETKKYSIEECLQISLKDERWVKANKTNQQELEMFNRQLEGCGEYSKNPLDYKTHFYFLKRKRPDVVKPEAAILSKDEWEKLCKDYDKQNKAA